MTNLCYNQLPRIKRELISLIPDEEAVRLPDVRSAPEEVVISAELRSHLHSTIEQLPESYRLLITLRHLQNMSYKEISVVTGMPLGTVKTGIFRARQMLKIEIEHFEVEYG